MLNRPKMYARWAWHTRDAGPRLTERAAAFRTLHQLETVDRNWTSGEEIAVDILGHPMRGLDPGTMKFLFYEVFLRHQYRFSSVVTDPVIVDCGANIGFSILYFKQLYPAARIHAFEPNPRTVGLLKQNVETNRLSGVVLHDVALSDQDGEIAFHIGDDPGALMGSVRADRGGAQSTTVAAERLSTTLATLERVDLVKMDVEGAEWRILADLSQSGMLGKPRRYIIEYHHQMGVDPPRLSEFVIPFEQSGFRYQVGGHIRQPTEFQDILIHLVRDDLASDGEAATVPA